MVEVTIFESFNRVEISGKIDYSNVKEVERDIYDNLEHNCKNIIIDAENLTYITDAGLELILKLKNDFPDMEIDNVTADVFETLEVAELTEKIKITRGYRKISLEGCITLGGGKNGVVYRYDKDTVVKVYRSVDSLEVVEREGQLSRSILSAGIPTVIPFDIVKVGGCFGSAYKLSNAVSLSQLIAQQPNEVDGYLAGYVDLIKKIHCTKAEGSNGMKSLAQGWAEQVAELLSPEQGEKLIELVEEIPEQNSLIYGNFHTDNVIMQNDQMVLVDVSTISSGHPIFDLSAMFTALVGGDNSYRLEPLSFIKMPYERARYVWNKSLSLYLGTEDEQSINEVGEKVMLMGYLSRMGMALTQFGLNDPRCGEIVELCQENLEELLDKVESLVF